jgi:hypothetical protein
MSGDDFAGADPRINLRGVEVAMAEEPLHVSEVRPALHEMGRAGVPPEMSPPWALDPGALFILRNQLCENGVSQHILTSSVDWD